VLTDLGCVRGDHVDSELEDYYAKTYDIQLHVVA